MKPAIRGSCGERQDPVEIGSVGEDLHGESSSTRRLATVASKTKNERSAAVAIGARAAVAAAPSSGLLVRARRILDDDRPAACGGSCLDVSVRVADHPGGRQVEVELSRGVEQHPGRRFTAVAGHCQAGHRSIRVVEAEPERVRLDSLSPKQFEHARLHALERVERHRSLRRSGLVGNADEDETRITEPLQARGRAGNERHPGWVEWRLRQAGAGIRYELVDDAVAIEEGRRTHREAIDSQCPCLTARSGCETSACQTTAWNDSTSGVRRSSGGATSTAASASSASVPPGLPTTP